MEGLETDYRIVDLKSWDRADKFKYFLETEKCIITVTANVDVTDLVMKCKEHGLKFYSVLICLASYVFNRRECFRFGYDPEGHVVIFDSIKPFYTDAVNGGESFNCIVTDYVPDMKKMYERISADREKYRDVEIMEPENMSANIFSITALPAVHYTQLNLNDASNAESLSPAIAIGKYELHEGRLMMPLTLWIHHAVCDGFHVNRFYKDVVEMMPEVIGAIINEEGKGEKK